MLHTAPLNILYESKVEHFQMSFQPHEAKSIQIHNFYNIFCVLTFYLSIS